MTAPITGRCYCGATRLSATTRPLVVAYCHCLDCRRVTGAPVTAWAAFDESVVRFVPDQGRVASPNPGVRRWFCGACGSSLACRYDYLPGQVYVPIGIIDQAAELVPELHAHEAERLSWLTIADGTERFAATSRSRLNAAAGDPRRTEGPKP
jgi:hypothetical protein